MSHLTSEEYREIAAKIPIMAADVVAVNNEGEILLMKRATEPYSGRWCTVGGLMEKGETIEQTALREFTEETGLDGEIIDMIGVYSAPDRDPRGHYVSIAFLVRITGGEMQGNEEVSELRFFRADQLPEDMGFDHSRVLKDAVKKLKTIADKD